MAICQTAPWTFQLREVLICDDSIHAVSPDERADYVSCFGEPDRVDQTLDQVAKPTNRIAIYGDACGLRRLLFQGVLQGAQKNGQAKSRW